MIQEHQPISLKSSSCLLNIKDEIILEILESVFVSKIPNYIISPGRIKVRNATLDTIIKLHPQMKQKISITGSNSTTVDDRGLNETVTDFKNNSLSFFTYL